MQVPHFVAEENAGIPGDDAGAEFGSEGLCERNNVAVRIDDV
jgi:hypothetical protein